ncbi:hypothetical protein BJX62DRAFT_200868 [Aspergillus germanicus]
MDPAARILAIVSRTLIFLAETLHLYFLSYYVRPAATTAVHLFSVSYWLFTPGGMNVSATIL